MNMVEAILCCACKPRAPKRLVLGSDAYTWVRANLLERLTASDAQKDAASAAGK